MQEQLQQTRIERMTAVMQRLYNVGIRQQEQLVLACLPFAREIYEDTSRGGSRVKEPPREEVILGMIEEASTVLQRS